MQDVTTNLYSWNWIVVDWNPWHLNYFALDLQSSILTWTTHLKDAGWQNVSWICGPWDEHLFHWNLGRTCNVENPANNWTNYQPQLMNARFLKHQQQEIRGFMEQWPGPTFVNSSNDVGEVMEQLQCWGCKSLRMLQARVGEAAKFQSKLSWTSGKAGRWHDYEWNCRNAKAKSNFYHYCLVFFLKSDLFEAWNCVKETSIRWI